MLWYGTFGTYPEHELTICFYCYVAPVDCGAGNYWDGSYCTIVPAGLIPKLSIVFPINFRIKSSLFQQDFIVPITHKHLILARCTNVKTQKRMVPLHVSNLFSNESVGNCVHYIVDR